MALVRVLVLASKKDQAQVLAGRRVVERVLAEARKVSRTARLVERVPRGLRGALLVIDGNAPLADARSWRELLGQARKAGLAAASVDDGCGHDDCRDGIGAWYFSDGRAVAGHPAKALERAFARGEAKLFNVACLSAADFISVAAPEGRDAVEREFRERQVWRLRAAGALVADPASTFVDEGVIVGAGTLIEPMCILKGATRIGRGCVIGPMTRISDSRVEDGALVEQSVLNGARVGRGAKVGPWARLRPGAKVGRGAHVGNFVELKNASLGEGAKANHLSYLGDAVVGKKANIGAGSITANYDGERKHPSRIGEGAFIGSGTVLVAPIRVGKKAMTGAGAVLLKNQNLPDGKVAVGVPARVLGRPSGPHPRRRA